MGLWHLKCILLHLGLSHITCKQWYCYKQREISILSQWSIVCQTPNYRNRNSTIWLYPFYNLRLPNPHNITDVRSWFGLNNQVTWAYSISIFVEPSHDLVRSNTKFYWDHKRDQIFVKFKELLISIIIEGIHTFHIPQKKHASNRLEQRYFTTAIL